MDRNVEIQKPKLDLDWLAVYENGDSLKQNYGKKDEKNFGDIDLAKLNEFWLVDKEGNQDYGLLPNAQCIVVNGYRFNVDFPRNKKGKEVKPRIVYFRRIRNDFRPEGQVIVVRYVIGYQAKIDGINYQQYVFINPDSTFTLSQKK